MGGVCEYNVLKLKEGDTLVWDECRVRAYDDDEVWLKTEFGSIGVKVENLDFRPLRTKYDELVAAAEAAIETETGEPANSRHIGVLVKLGWRPPKN